MKIAFSNLQNIYNLFTSESEKSEDLNAPKKPKGMRLLELSPIAFRKIIRQMNVIELLSLSQLSKKIKTQIMLIDIQFDCIEINTLDSKKSITFRNNWKDPMMILRFQDKNIFSDNKNLKIGNCTIKISSKNADRNEYNCKTAHFTDDLGNLLDYFSSIFRFRSGFASIELLHRSTKMRKLIDHPIFNDRLLLKLSGRLRSGYTDLEMLLYKYRHLEGIMVNFKFFKAYFDYKEIFTLKRACIADAKWMTRGDLLSTNFQRLKLIAHKLTTEDLNEFIKNWLNGSNRRLCRLEITFPKGKNEQMREITQDLNVMKWNFKRRDGDYIMDTIQSPYTINARNGMDIERNDGLLATIMFHENTFLFVVWHCRFNRRLVYPNRPITLINNL